VSKYLAFVERTRVVDRVEACVTGGDVEYPGLVVEICDPEGRELFHVIGDGKGGCQLLVFAAQDHFRLPLDVLEPLLARAKSVVARTGVPPE
jgi:hypothetical protein